MAGWSPATLPLTGRPAASPRIVVAGHGVDEALVSLGLATPLAVALFVGMALDLPTLIFMAGLGSLGLAVLRPTAGVALLAIMVPLREPEIFGPIWFNVTLASATLAGCVLRLPVERPSIAPSAGFLLLIGYLLFSIVTLPTIVSGFAAAPTETAIYQFIQLGGGVLIFTAGVLTFSRMDAIPILVAGTVSATVAAILSIVFLAAGSDDLPFRGIFSSAPWFYRAVGPFGNTNYLGEFLAFAILTAIGLIGLVRQQARMLLLACLPVLVIAFLLTFSRGAIVTLTVGLVCLAFARSFRVGLVALAVGLLAATIIVPFFLEVRLDAALGPGTETTSGLTIGDETRVDAFGAGLRLFAAHPVFGVGFGQFQTASGEYLIDAMTTYPHNSVIRVLAEQGVVGALMAGAVVLALARSLWRSVHPLRLTAIAVLVAYLAGSIVLEPFWSIQTSASVWLLFAAVIVRPPAGLSIGTTPTEATL
jgi:O-antigen ligase